MPQLQQTQIRQRATAKSYERGENYYQSKAIFDTVHQGDEIKGLCEGSSYQPYQVRAILNKDGNIVVTSCTCEYDQGGDCKHIVALLLTYLREPELFEQRAPVEDQLAERSQEELISLIRQMVERYPDLQTLIDRPRPSQQPKDKPVDTTPFRRELQQALRNFEGNYGDRYGSEHNVDEAISSVANAASEFAEAGKWHDASAIYRTILEECLDADLLMLDEEGDSIAALDSVLEAVVVCLQQEEIAEDDEERSALINHLLDAYILDVEIGGHGLGERIFPDDFLQHVRTEDLPNIRERIVQAQQSKMQSSYGKWGVEVYEEFLIHLDALNNTDPEETLRRLREQGLYRLLFERLISLERIDEAITVVAEHLTTPFGRLPALTQLAAVGREDEAIRLASATLRERFNDPLADWLAGRYQAKRDRNALFELWLQGMKKEPNINHYATLKEAAEAVGAWTRVRPDILNTLHQEEKFALLTSIYLVDEEWDATWETLELFVQRSSKGVLGGLYGKVSSLELAVAEKSQHVRPKKAIPVFVKYARQEIDLRDRSHYNQAAAYLLKVRKLYKQIGDEKSWQELIGKIRSEFPKLRALQDELNQAGL